MDNYTKNMVKQRVGIDELKKHLLDMLIAFDKFCRENGLRYSLSGGTLLGAVRHHGFIPWDDDIDINMPRPDCEKLMELSNGYIGDYILQPPNTSDYYHAYHWKLYDDSILLCKQRNYKYPSLKATPAFIDIFPIEGLPSSDIKNRAHYAKIIFWKKLFNCTDNVSLSVRALKKKPILIFKWIFKPVAMLFGRDRLFEKVIQVAKTIPYDESEYVGVMMTDIHTTCERVLKSEFMDLIQVEFEGHKFYGAKGYDTYLSQLYGPEYMQLPPPEKRKSRHRNIPFESDTIFRHTVTADEEKKENDTKEKKFKIALCGLLKSENLGEQFISDSLEYLIRQKYNEINGNEQLKFVEVDLLGRTDMNVSAGNRFKKWRKIYYDCRYIGMPIQALYEFLKRFTRKKISTIKTANHFYKLEHMIWNNGINLRKRLLRYYNKKFNGVDLIVVDGAGLLEYSYNEYQEALLLISQYAEKYDIPVIYNAIGRAGEYNEEDFRCGILKRALSSKAIRYVSARDSAEDVQKCVGERLHVELLADAAFWLKEAYNYCPAEKKENIIGIGLVRGNSLKGYGYDFSEGMWIELFTAIAIELDRRGYDYRFFTNGLPGDVKLGRKIVSYLNLPGYYLLNKPLKPKTLYRTIDGFNALITCRMHSAIAAFTLNIPAVILSWNEKVEKLMNIAGYPERAIKKDEFDAKLIVDRMEAAMNEGIDSTKIEIMKQKAAESVADYSCFLGSHSENQARCI